MNIRVILADDHPLILYAVRQTLGRELGMRVVAEAHNPARLLEELRLQPCDVLVTDFSMPHGERPDGLSMLRSVAAGFPQVRIVVLTMLDNLGLIVSMQKAGVSSVLNKRDDLAELPTAVLAAFQGRNYLSTSLQRQMEAQPQELTGQGEALDSLSPREMEVIRLLVSGMSTTEVAQRLHRSANTISTQKRHAMNKLGLDNDVELYAYAARHGLTS